MIRGQKVKLRHVEERDLDTLIRLLNDVQLRGDFVRTTMTSPHRIRQEYANNGMSSEASERLLIVGEEERVIGVIHHFTTVPYSSAREIGFQIFDVQARGKGYASEAAGLLVNYLFESFAVNRLEIRVHTGNEASEKIAINLGFRREGTLRGSMFVRGEYVDTHLYALLRDEWQARS